MMQTISLTTDLSEQIKGDNLTVLAVNKPRWEIQDIIPKLNSTVLLHVSSEAMIFAVRSYHIRTIIPFHHLLHLLHVYTVKPSVRDCTHSKVHAKG